MAKKISPRAIRPSNFVKALAACLCIFLCSATSSQAGGAVTIGGGVERPGEYPVARAGTLFALLAASGNVIEGAGVERAGLVRGEPGKETQWVFDLYKLLAKKEDIQLLPGDRVYISPCVMLGAGGIGESEMKAWNDSLADLEEARRRGDVKIVRLKAR